MGVWVGADWDREKCVVAYNKDGKVRHAKVYRTLESVKRFVDSFDDQVDVAIEDGDAHWVRLWEESQAVTHVFDPKKTQRFSESLSTSGARDDVRAADALLAQVQSPAHREQANPRLPTEYRALQNLLRLKDRATQSVLRHRNRLEEALRQYYPAFAAALHKKLSTHAILRLLVAAPTARAYRELKDKDESVLFKGLHQSTRALLRDTLGKEELPLSDIEEQVARATIQLGADALLLALQHQNSIKAQLAKVCETFPHGELLLDIDGLGPHIATGLLIAAGGAPAHRNAIATQTGCAPVTQRSGTSGDRAPNVSMRRSANKTLRCTAFLLGSLLIQNQRWAKAQYDSYRQRNITHAGALRRVARSFSRVVYALMRDGTPYDEEKYIRALKSKGVSWAMQL